MMTKLLVACAGVFVSAQVIVRPPSPQQSPPTQSQLAQSEQQLSGQPYQVLLAEKAWAGAGELVPLLSSSDRLVRIAAVTAVGRLEDPSTLPALMATQELNTSFAIAQALHGVDPAKDPQTIDRVGAPSGAAGGLIRYVTAEQVRAVELSSDGVAELAANDPAQAGNYEGAIAALESLARLNRRVKAFDDRTVKVLKNSIARVSANDEFPVIRKHAFTALINADAVDSDAEKIALNEQEWPIRRLAIQVLAGSGAGLDMGTRVAAIRSALADPSPIVRYEALRTYVRRGVPVSGCQPLVSMLSDDDTHVTLAALDALGDQCKDDKDITTRVLAETTTPYSQNWHRPSHAFVALAKRDHEKAVSSMETFAAHANWWVRMYAARAAAILEDAIELEKLSGDVNDNVREATLVPLRRLKHFDADPAIAATLNSRDVQLLRTAALLLKESPHTHDLFRPLMTALTRLTTEGKETSRDARLALLDAIEVHIRQSESPELTPLLKDFDPKVSARAAQLMTKLTGKETVAEPVPPHRGWPAAFNHNKDTCVTVNMAFGGTFVLDMDWAAPITVDHFLKLATKDHYYDGLTFHRVEPNFVIQGGSPGANEYSGAKDYMRDEISPLKSHVRGTVGLSTRGRNTADAQFFVNLVDNPRLDLSYTIFASVRDADMAAVDRIEEGAEIRSIALGCAPKPRSK
jgi:cyclophilin family peptidyl-prolyl cis-trans isomerase/HEAT repeat protein